jgi:hypothetical protein
MSRRRPSTFATVMLLVIYVGVPVVTFCGIYLLWGILVSLK